MEISVDSGSIAIRVEEKQDAVADCAGLGDLMHLPLKAYSPDVYSRLGFGSASSSDVAKQTRSWRYTRRSSS
jgi:ABC-type polysaccharide/polyol phosphate transport system ATPase subunit